MKDYLENPDLLSSRSVPPNRLGLRELARDYDPDPRLKQSINQAIDSGRPVLITGGLSDGENGLAAYYTAYKLESELFHFRTRQDSTAKELLYNFDSVAYMHDAQTAMREPLQKGNYVQPGPLWRAAEQGLSAKKPMVLLVDALDRAPAGFLEDLLLELDLLSFSVPELAQTVELPREYSPIVFLTANNIDKIDSYIKSQCINYTFQGSVYKEAQKDMTSKTSMVFISYAHEDTGEANRLYADLRQKGIDAWIDSENLLPGQNWQNEINKAIQNCTYFVALLF
jgi:hypothetical protein